MHWRTTSRSGTLRTYHVYGDMLTAMCYDVFSYKFSTDTEQNVISVDPTGGPRLFIGKCVEHNGYTWTIKSVLFHYKNKSVAVFVFAI